MIARARARGVFLITCFRSRQEPVKLWEHRFHNMTTNAGLNHQIGVELAAVSKESTWYLGLINNAGFTNLAAGDTSSSHTGWTELTDYSEGVRQTWTPGSVASQQVTNPTPASFTISGTVSINGAFLISNSTKGGTTGTLFATGSFGAPQSLIAANVLQVTYTYSMTGA